MENKRYIRIMKNSIFEWLWRNRAPLIAALSLLGIAAHLILRFGWQNGPNSVWPLGATLVLGGGPLVYELANKLTRRQFGSDLLAGISIVTSVILGEYLAGSLVVLMLSGGEALEAYAVQSASSVLRALSKRMPSVAHKKVGHSIENIDLKSVVVGDILTIFPHETCPVDGIVVEGHGVMDESYLTGEPYIMSKSPGTSVLSGSINGDSALVIRAEKLAEDSRYAKIVKVIQSAEEKRPNIRRLADRLGAWYTPLAVVLAIFAWLISGDPLRFLAVLVVATPCPLLIAIPVAIIGSISLAAKRAIIIRDPSALETADVCRTIIFDKTGTLTYGKPKLVEVFTAEGVNKKEVLSLASSLERLSKHPLAEAIVKAGAELNVAQLEVEEMSERPGEGLTGLVAGRTVKVTSRQKLIAAVPEIKSALPPTTAGLECLILLDDKYAATFQFRDAPRRDGKSFISHLSPRHRLTRTLLVSGDRASEVEYLAQQVGIKNIYAGQSPEQKLQIVNAETALAPTIFVGDGINDAPALMAATIGIAFGQNSDVTTESADVVVLDSSLQKIDEFLHISRRMRQIALQSAIGGMALSILGMGFAIFGLLPPVWGAISQEAIDILAVLNALRVAWIPRSLVDYALDPVAPN
ncbi:MAG: heavy metal translocating P-type ATPase [Pirellulaceae bacterium]